MSDFNGLGVRIAQNGRANWLDEIAVQRLERLNIRPVSTPSWFDGRTSALRADVLLTMRAAWALADVERAPHGEQPSLTQSAMASVEPRGAGVQVERSALVAYLVPIEIRDQYRRTEPTDEVREMLRQLHAVSLESLDHEQQATSIFGAEF
jgi:hypothetical protein